MPESLERISMIPDLLVRPAPISGEGARGYLLRLAEANYMNVRDLAQLGVGFTIPALQQHRLLPDERLHPGLYRHVHHLARLQQAHPVIWNHRFSRYCPHCLAGEPIWRAEWELLFFDTCPRHGVWLVDRCTSCGEQLDWQRDSLMRCRCGADLRQEEPTAAPASSVMMAEELEGLLLQKPVEPEHRSSPLSGLGIEQAVRLIRFMGTYLDAHRQGRPLKIRDAGAMAVSWPVTSLAAEMLVCWPDKFHRALNQLQGGISEQKPSLNRLFGAMGYYLYTGGLRDQVFQSVRDAFKQWLIDDWRGGLTARNRRLLDLVQQQVKWIPAKWAADRLGIPMARLRYLIRTGQLEGQETISEKGRHTLMVRSDQLPALEEAMAGEITMTNAVTLLGVGKARLRRILRLLFPSARRSNDQVHLPWCISSTEVYQLAEFGEELPRITLLDDDQISLADVLHYWQWNADEVVSLIEEVIAGRLTVMATQIGKTGISRWVFNRKQLKQWRGALDTGRVHWLTIPELASVLNVKQQVAYWLTQNEYIRAYKLGTAKGIGSRVKKVEVDRFLRTHLFATEIADRIGRSPRKVMRMLAVMGIYPLRGHSVEQCRQLVYTRSESLDRFIERNQVCDPVKLRESVRKRQNAWDRIIQENGMPVDDPSQFRLESN